MIPSRSLPRELAGVLVKDTLRYERALRARGDAGWLGLCNRAERVRRDPAGDGVECLWTGSSNLHAPGLVPSWGRRLMARALARHPVRFRTRPPPLPSGGPDVSFVIMHRGLARLPLLLATLRSLAAQEGVSVECVVAEDSDAVEIRDALPDWVRHAHRRPPVPGSAFNRAGAINTGVSASRGRVVILHDNDLLAPVDYAAEALRLVDAGHEIVNHKRHIFYTSEREAAAALAAPDGAALAPSVPLTILQNATGGGSIALSRDAFEAVGGMDESFVGWGGEDTEFWQRARTRRVWPYGFLPLAHLWHPPQPGKTPAKKTPAMDRLASVAAIPPSDRIATLRAGRAAALPSTPP